MSLALRRGLAARLLRRHVARRAEDHVRTGVRLVSVARAGRCGQQAGEPEVEQLHVAVGAHHDVLRLDVAMHDAGGVRGGERLGELRADAAPPSRSAGAADQRVERLALDELRREEPAVVELADLVDGDDVRVVERRSGARFLLEPANGVGLPGESVRSSFSATLRPSLRVVREVDLAHAAAPEQATTS